MEDMTRDEEDLQPSSPSAIVPPRRLKSPERTRTPELTSRSLQRCPDAHSLDIYKSDNAFTLDEKVNDGDLEEDWHINLCTEPAECDNQKDIENVVDDLAQERNELHRWACLAANMESETAGENESPENSPFTRAIDGSSNTQKNDNVISSIADCGSFGQHDPGPQVRVADQNVRRIDGYTPDHEVCNSDEDTADIDSKGDHCQKAEVIEQGEDVEKENPEYRSLRAEAECSETKDLSFGVTRADDSQVEELITEPEGIRCSHHNKEQFLGKASSTPKLSVPLPTEKFPDTVVSSIGAGDEALHRLLESGCVSLAYCPGQELTGNHRIVEVEILPVRIQNDYQNPRYLEQQIGLPMDKSYPVDVQKYLMGGRNQKSSLSVNESSDPKEWSVGRDTEFSEVILGNFRSEDYQKAKLYDAESSEHKGRSKALHPEGVSEDGDYQNALKRQILFGDKEKPNYSFDQGRKGNKPHPGETYIRLEADRAMPSFMHNFSPERVLRKGTSKGPAVKAASHPTTQRICRAKSQGNCSQAPNSHMRSSYPDVSAGEPLRSRRSQLLTSANNTQNRMLGRDHSNAFTLGLSKDSHSQSSRVPQKTAHDQVAQKRASSTKKPNLTCTTVTKSHVEYQTKKWQLKEEELGRHRDERPLTKGRSNAELEDSYLELAEKVASIRPNQVPGKNGRGSSTPSYRQIALFHKVARAHYEAEDHTDRGALATEQIALAQSLAEQRLEFDRISQAKDELWEGKLRELQKDKYELQIRLQALGMESPRERIKRSGENIQLTDEEIALLRQEITEQEALIKGYQTENERAVKRLKDLESTHKERCQLMADENARLASQLASMQFTSRVSVYGATPDAAKEIQAMRVDLHALQTIETALKVELDKEKKAVKDLERILPAMRREKEEELGTLKQMLAEERMEHARAIDTKEEQNNLYLRGQEVIHSLQTTVEDQASTITDLRRKVRDLEEAGKENGTKYHAQSQLQKGWSNIQKTKALKQIEGLQIKVRKLESALKSRSGPLEDTKGLRPLVNDSEPTIKRLREELSALQSRTKDDETLRALQALKQEHDQLKHEYKTRVHNLTQQVKKEKASNDYGLLLKKDKYVDKQVEEIRTFYMKKVKDLTKQLEETRKGNAKGLPKPEHKKGADRIVGKGTEEKQNLDHMNKSEHALSDKDVIGRRLQETVKALEAVKGAISDRDATIQSLQEKIITLEIAKGGECASSNFAEVAALRKQLESAEIAREAVQKTCTEAMERAAVITVQHQQAMASLKEGRRIRFAEVQQNQKANSSSVIQLETSRQKSKNQSLERENDILESRVKTQLEDLGSETHAGPISPRMAQLEILRRKLEDMEDRQRGKVIEWQKLSHEAKKLCGLGTSEEEQEQNWQAAMAAKNREIDEFRSELNSVMQEAFALQNSELRDSQ